MGGEQNPDFDQYAFSVQKGDVIAIKEVGVVHTVIGAILEEYATVSNDNVNRLYDQNANNGTPAAFTRANAMERIRNLQMPSEHNYVEWKDGDHTPAYITSDKTPEGSEVELVRCNEYIASRLSVRPGMLPVLKWDNQFTTSLYFTRGQGELILFSPNEFGRPTPTLPIQEGSMYLIPPGAFYAIKNNGKEPIEASQHKVVKELSFL